MLDNCQIPKCQWMKSKGQFLSNFMTIQSCIHFSLLVAVNTDLEWGNNNAMEFHSFVSFNLSAVTSRTELPAFYSNCQMYCRNSALAKAHLLSIKCLEENNKYSLGSEIIKIMTKLTICLYIVVGCHVVFDGQNDNL